MAHRGMLYLVGFPLMLIPIVIYNIVAFLMASSNWYAPLATIRMISGGEWQVAANDLLISFALVMLFIETVKSTRTGMKSVIDHGLSTVVFIGALIEFLLVARAATSTFFTLMLICLVDVIGGYSVSISTARRDFTVERTEP